VEIKCSFAHEALYGVCHVGRVSVMSSVPKMALQHCRILSVCASSIESVYGIKSLYQQLLTLFVSEIKKSFSCLKFIAREASEHCMNVQYA
jgi:hypothetical protein